MNDTTTVRMVVVFLGVTILACVIGGFWLAAQTVEVPEFLIGLGGTALGALGALLTRTDNRRALSHDAPPDDDHNQLP